MNLFTAMVLGFVQGATEFIPVSSTGHLVLARLLLGIQDTDVFALKAFLPFAIAGSILVYFFDEIFALTQTLFRKLGRLPVNEKDMIIMKALLLAAIPGVIVGITLSALMESAFQNPILVALVLVAGAFFFGFAEYRYQNNFHNREITVPTGFTVGLFQLLSVIPGIAPSGAAISGGMILGLSRTEATRFSFLLLFPVILGSGVQKGIELITTHRAIEWFPVGVSIGTAFVVGLFAIHFMIAFMRKYSLWPFIWYRVILAGFVLFVTFFS